MRPVGVFTPFLEQGTPFNCDDDVPLAFLTGVVRFADLYSLITSF